MVTPAAKREAVAHLVETYEVSERRACRLIRADRKTVRYRSRRPRDEELRRRLRELAAKQRRFGYRRLHVLLRAEGHLVNREKIQWLYREEGLTVRKRKGRMRAVGSRTPILIEVGPNARWSVDFVDDQLSDGRRFRIPQCDRRRHEGMPGRDRRHLDLWVARRPPPIMEPSSPRTQCSPGRRSVGSPGISFCRASRCRTESAKRSMAKCATNCSMRRSSTISATPERLWPVGARATTKSARIPRSAI